MKKYYIYFAIFIFMFFISFLDVNAGNDNIVRNVKVDSYSTICYDNNLNYVRSVVGLGACGDYHDTVIKEMNDTRAYCGTRKRTVALGLNHIFDSEWSSATSCGYKKTSNGETIKNGWCSEILGFVINEARKSAYGPSDELHATMRAQAAVWTYLWNFTYNEKWSYANDNNAWKNNPTVRNIILNAFTRYLNAIGSSPLASESSEKKDDNIISISDKNVTLYYKPNNNSCGKGSYQSKEITINNNSGHDIKLELSHSIKGVKICDNDGCSSKKNVNITRGNNYKFYLWSASKVNAKSLGISVYASYLENTTHIFNEEIYDTARYYVDEGNIPEANKQLQSIIIPIDSSIKKEQPIRITHYTEQKIKFSYKGVSYKTCSTKKYNYSDNNGNHYSNTNAQLGKKCANGISEDKLEEKKNVYTATFKGCTCRVLDIDNHKVRIIVKENTSFVYGTLSPNTLYPGGGFGLAANKNDGVLTKYSTNITWDYSDYSDDKPYYFDANKGEGKDASVLASKIEDKLRNDIRENLRLNVATRSSNVGSYSNVVEKNDYSIKLNINADDLRYDSEDRKLFRTISVSLPKAYFTSNGKVYYVKKNNRDEADNKFYVPIDYTVGASENQPFPFNISESNLSISGYFNFRYAAKCNVDVIPYDLDGNLAYRSISEENPFPKYTPANWIEWWKNDANKNRIKNSFNNYPDNPLYRISFNESEINRILNDNTGYTSWGNIKENGTSKYVVSGIFDKVANDSSYCNRGKFGSDCDK